MNIKKNVMLKYYKSAVLMLFLVSILIINISCILFEEPTNIRLDTKWEVPIIGYAGNWDYIIHNDDIIIPEVSGLCSINLDNGIINWRSELNFSPGSNPIVWNECVFCFDDINPYLWCFDLHTGKLTEKITFPNESETFIAWNCIAANENLIVFPYKHKANEPTRLTYIDTDSRTFIGYDEDILVSSAEVNTAYVFDELEKIRTSSMPIFNENRVYTRAYKREYDLTCETVNGVVICLDMKDFSLVWKKESNYVMGFSQKPLSILGDFLYESDVYNAAWNKNTGEVIYEKRFSGAGDGGVFFYYDKIYYTNGHISEEWDSFHPGETIMCINRFTGDIIWSTTYDYTLGSNPIVADNICYISTGSSVRIYTATHGIFLGADDSIQGPIYQLAWIGTYKDTFLLPTSDQLTCIKM